MIGGIYTQSLYFNNNPYRYTMRGTEGTAKTDEAGKVEQAQAAGKAELVQEAGKGGKGNWQDKTYYESLILAQDERWRRA